MKWDLENILYPEYLDKLLNSNKSVSLVGFMYRESRKTINYTRAMAMGLDSYQVTTTKSIFENTGIYMLDCSIEKKPVTLIGTSDMLFKLNLEQLFSKKIKLNIIEVVENYSEISNLDEKYLVFQNIINHKFISFDTDEVFYAFLSIYSPYIKYNYNLLDVKDIYMLDAKLKSLDFKLNLLDISSIFLPILRNYNSLVDLSTLSKYFNNIYIKLDESSLGYLLSAYNIDGLKKIINLFHEHNMYFKIANENSSLYSLKDFISLLV